MKRMSYWRPYCRRPCIGYDFWCPAFTSGSWRNAPEKWPKIKTNKLHMRRSDRAPTGTSISLQFQLCNLRVSLVHKCQTNTSSQFNVLLVFHMRVAHNICKFPIYEFKNKIKIRNFDSVVQFGSFAAGRTSTGSWCIC